MLGAPHLRCLGGRAAIHSFSPPGPRQAGPEGGQESGSGRRAARRVFIESAQKIIFARLRTKFLKKYANLRAKARRRKNRPQGERQ